MPVSVIKQVWTDPFHEAILAKSPLALWGLGLLDSSMRIEDLSGNGFHGTQASAQIGAYRTLGQYDGDLALQGLNGTTGTIGGASALKASGQMNQFTILYLAKAKVVSTGAANAYQNAAAMGLGGVNEAGGTSSSNPYVRNARCGIAATALAGNLACQIRVGATNTAFTDDLWRQEHNTWFLLAFTWDGTTAKVYGKNTNHAWSLRASVTPATGGNAAWTNNPGFGGYANTNISGAGAFSTFAAWGSALSSTDLDAIAAAITI